jgi:hypothetical protein
MCAVYTPPTTISSLPSSIPIFISLLLVILLGRRSLTRLYVSTKREEIWLESNERSKGRNLLAYMSMGVWNRRVARKCKPLCLHYCV